MWIPHALYGVTGAGQCLYSRELITLHFSALCYHTEVDMIIMYVH